MKETDIKCTGCGVTLNIENIGGYRCFCDKCVSVMPELPEDNNGYFIEGSYPSFKWVSGNKDV